MRIFTADQLTEILQAHKYWLRGKTNGVRADLHGANLSEADLHGANLSGANLSGANLSEADLSGANLSEADLSWASLRGADLSWASLRGADLRGASLSEADLSEADLRGASLRGADLRGADLSGANLREADLRWADLREVPKIPQLNTKILAAINQPGHALDMSTWHRCETTHCRAGWAVTLAGEDGKKLEYKFGPATAGALIYAASCPNSPVPDFYATNEVAMQSIRDDAAKEQAAT